MHQPLCFGFPASSGDLLYGITPAPAREWLGRRTAARLHGAAPEAVAAANPGCLLQIGSHLGARRAPLPLFHPVELLDASIRGVEL